MTVSREILWRLGRETGRILGELGVRPEDHEWIRAQAEAIASLAGRKRRRGLPNLLYRLARSAARTAR